MHRHKVVTGFLFSLLLSLTFISLALSALAAPASSDHDQTDRSVTGQDWTNYVRIGAYGLSRNSADQIVRNAQESGVFGIEVDNDIPGRYESFRGSRGEVASDSRRCRESARGGESRIRLHRRNGMHHGERGSDAAHARQGSSRLAAAQDHWRARNLRRRQRLLDQERR